MSEPEQSKSETPSKNDLNEFIPSKEPKESSGAQKYNSSSVKKGENKLHQLLEEKDDLMQDDEDIQNISFSLSQCDDMNDLLDNFSNKSDEKLEFEYESTTNEEGLEMIEDFLKESTRQILNNKKGFDEDVKKMTNDFYNDLIKNINEPQKDFKKKYKYPLDKTKNTFYKTQSESITSDEITHKFKNDLIGQTYENKQSGDVAQNFGKVFSLNSKNKSNGSNSQYIGEEDDEDKIIEIRKKK